MESLPTELLTTCFAYLEPHDLMNVLSVSRTLRSAASHDALWRSHCEHVYNKGSQDILGWRPVESFIGLKCHLVWRRLAILEPYLGWWMSIDELPAGSVMRIWVDGLTLVVSSVLPAATAPSTSIPETLALTNTMDYIVALTVRRGLASPLYIDAQNVCLDQWSAKQSVQWLQEGPSRIMHQPHRIQNFYVSNKFKANSPSQQQPLKWTFRNSPSLVNAITHEDIVYDEEGYAIVKSVPTLSFPRGQSPRPFVGIPSPFEESDSSTLIAGGAWIASYGEVHGCEFLHIHARRINEHDLNGQWGDEGSLADAVTPTAQDVQSIFMLPAPPAPVISSEDVQVGNIIIEAIKMTGDANVPRGVRTFFGFVDHPETWSGPSENGEFVPRATSHPWPLAPGSTFQRGIPAAALHTDLSEMKAQDIPARGMTMAGLMRVADTGFSNPKWASATVHIVSRREIRVMLLDGHHVTTFYKVQKSMFEPMN
ncbi:F-box-like domain-containing protein [Rhizoctonia solani AG-1 IA]|uniref:F-box domain-containing protein n=2 Tax=Rhizoctonia solani TaxID=456999 RepID=A0A8H7LGX0_9AGAM|nr:F-box-like domain-containing protein [Rhizoctonia solani AG-1 IA]KAF8671965.1 hypothetical protein RHS04_07960 [Rhizoctonia solani]